MDRVLPTFFQRDPVTCARELIGADFWWRGRAGRIVETEAYSSTDDPACHTWFRPSARKFVKDHQAGDAYVYLNYGVHWLFNILVKGESQSGFVLLRALEIESGLGAGPGRLTRALGIDGSIHGTSFLNGPDGGITWGNPVNVISGKRIGISKAVDLPWRFGDPSSASLSRRF